jgi:arylsulfatase A-like enzyme
MPGRLLWTAALGLALGAFAGLLDALLALWQDPGLANGRELFLYFSNALGWYGLFWLAALSLFGMGLVVLTALLGNGKEADSNFTAHIISAGLTLQVYVATVVLMNDRLLPYSTSLKSIAGNLFFLVAMAALFYFLFMLFKAAVRSGRGKFYGGLLKKAVYALGLFCICNLVWALSGNPGAASPKRIKSPGNQLPDVNVILITMDALRPDHLSCYGYQKSKTPNIDLLAEQGVRFENALSNAPHTFPSFSSMFTSVHPDALGFCQFYPIPDAFPTLAQTLSDAGVNTAAVLTNPFLSPELQITRGFNYYYHAFEPGFLQKIQGTHLNLFLGRVLNRMAFEENAGVLTGQAIKWLGDNRSRPFFLWLYLMEAHFPYGDAWIKNAAKDPDYKGSLGDHLNDPDLATELSMGTRDFSPEDIRHIEYLYDRDIRYADDQLGKLFQYLKDNGLWEKTAIILVADHGEAFGERKLIGHSNHLYWEYTHIPMLVKMPGAGAARTVKAQVELLDLYPTVLDIFKVKAPETVEGKSMIGLLRGETETHKDYFYSVCNRYERPEIFLRDSRYSLLYHPREKDYLLFDRSVDPLETTDISRAQPEAAARLLQALMKIKKADKQLFLKYHPGGKAPGAVHLDRGMLRSLGYVK